MADTAAVDPQVWETARVRLVRFARSLGIDGVSSEDIAQESLCRAVTHSIPFTDVEDLLRWCQTVARRLAMDEHRRSRRAAFLTPVEGHDTDFRDVAEHVANRDLLRRALTELVRLPDVQRDALVGVISDRPPTSAQRKEQVRLAVARSRGRAALRTAVGYGTFLVAAVAAAVRRSARTGPAMAAVAATALVTAFLSATSPGAGALAIHPSSVVPATHAVPHSMPAQGAQVVEPASPPSSAHGGVNATAHASARPLVKAHVAGIPVAADQRPRSAGDHLLCISGGPLPTSTCVG